LIELFCFRRFVRIASEDVGLGDPAAMGMAVAAMQGCQMIGKPGTIHSNQIPN
jgi:putative ATPase